MSGAVAFVTRELYPFGPGGIGRLVHLLVKQALDEGASRVHLYFASATEPARDTLSREFGARVTLSTFAPSDDAFTEARAAAAHLAARDDGPFEWIEFPDFRGLGAVVLNEALVRPLPGAPELRVRIHGPSAIIAWHEGSPLEAAHATEFDLERVSLATADRVIAPLASVRDAVGAFFRLGPAWSQRVEVAFPPRPPQVDVTARTVTSIVFPTKLQQIKRPDLFVDAGVELMRARPGWKGQLVIAAHRHDAIELALRGRIPRELAARFSWPEWNEGDRQRELAGQVVVVPSDFETLSLAAWEAAGLGARVVASERCPAFAEATPWRSWPGFFAFDGTVASLAAAMGRALEAPAPKPFAPKADALPVRAAASVRREVDLSVVAAPPAEWLGKVAAVSSEWLALSSGTPQVAQEFADAARTMLSTRAALGSVSTFGSATGGVMRTSAAFARAPAIAARTAVLGHGLRAGMGPRGLLALVAASDEAGFFFTESDGSSTQVAERFPPSELDVHPFLLRAARPSLRTQLYEKARDRLADAARRFRR
jgi:DNA-binding transcriptional regulator YdaS (Cro superfamily)